jgi:Ser/Thr protein kinase RdoA (MazF antagonist)
MAAGASRASDASEQARGRWAKLPRVGPLAAEHTLLRGSALADVVRDRYDIGDVRECALWTSSVNDTYRVSGERDLALRVYRHGWRTDAEVAAELQAIRLLADAGIPVAAAVADGRGDLFSTVDASEGPRQIALFNWCEGKPLVPPIDHARRFGETVACMHAAADEVAMSAWMRRLDLDHLLEEPMRWLSRRLASRERELHYLADVAAVARSALEDRVSDLDWGFCHGDLHGGNAHARDDGTIAHFDFDCAGVGWRAYDISVYLWATDTTRHPNGTRDCWDAFVDGYRARRDLSDRELEAVRWFVIGRQIWLMGLHARQLPAIGSQYLSNLWLDRHITILRAWLANELQHDVHIKSVED